ncbi:hypothetical protein AB4431_03375 [Vibrio artabrorum]|uniref:hypothetical protein n=1 Tax=Vibrio artabrorum TaxID=446374 RepID=UPI00354E11C0
MSRNLKHYQALDELVTNALLALYGNIRLQGGFWSVKKINEQLVKLGLDSGIKGRALSVSPFMINESTPLCSRASIKGAH